jgi:hypothetical protein
MSALTGRQLPHIRLSHLGLAAPAGPDVPIQAIVRRLGALQAQDYAGAKWAIGARRQGTTDAEVERAYAAGEILRTHLLRPTWHFVAPQDIRWLLALTAPRVRQRMAPGNRELEIDADLVAHSNRLLAAALEDGTPRTRDELRAVLAAGGVHTGGGTTRGETNSDVAGSGEADSAETDSAATDSGQTPGEESSGGRRLAHLLMCAELDGVICSGPRRAKQFTYMLLEARVPPQPPLPADEAAAELVRRFFRTRGPATVQDCARWSGLTVTAIRLGLAACGAELREERIDGQMYWLSADGAPVGAPVGAQVEADSGAPVGDSPHGSYTHLLSIFDEYMASYADRRAMVRPEYVSRLAGLGNGLVNIVVLEGQVVGAWRRHERARTIGVELNLFRPLQREEREAVAAAGVRYAAFFGKDLALTDRPA